MLRHLTLSEIDTVRELSAMGCTIAEIADAMEMTVPQFRRMRSVNPELDKAMRDWMHEADENVERALYRKALTGDVNAAKTWLAQRKPDAWNRKASDKKDESKTVVIATGIPRDGDNPEDTKSPGKKDTPKLLTTDVLPEDTGDPFDD